MKFATLVFVLGCGLALIGCCYPLGFTNLLIRFSRQIVAQYNRLKAHYRLWVIKRDGTAEWQQRIRVASVIAQKSGFRSEEVLDGLMRQKSELIEFYGTRLVRQRQPDLFKELDMPFDGWQ